MSKSHDHGFYLKDQLEEERHPTFEERGWRFYVLVDDKGVEVETTNAYWKKWMKEHGEYMDGGSRVPIVSDEYVLTSFVGMDTSADPTRVNLHRLYKTSYNRSLPLPGTRRLPVTIRTNSRAEALANHARMGFRIAEYLITKVVRDEWGWAPE